MKKKTLFCCLFIGHSMTSNHETFSLLYLTSTFLMFAIPKCCSNNSLVQLFGWSFSAKTTRNNLSVHESIHCSPMYYNQQELIFVFFLFHIFCQWWDSLCTVENMLIGSCAALVPLPSSPSGRCDKGSLFASCLVR